MGVLPLEFGSGLSVDALGLTGLEAYALAWDGALRPHLPVRVTATAVDGSPRTFPAVAALHTPSEVACLRAGGILPATLDRLSGGGG